MEEGQRGFELPVIPERTRGRPRSVRFEAGIAMALQQKSSPSVVLVSFNSSRYIQLILTVTRRLIPPGDVGAIGSRARRLVQRQDNILHGESG